MPHIILVGIQRERERESWREDQQKVLYFVHIYDHSLTNVCKLAAQSDCYETHPHTHTQATNCVNKHTLHSTKTFTTLGKRKGPLQLFPIAVQCMTTCKSLNYLTKYSPAIVKPSFPRTEQSLQASSPVVVVEVSLVHGWPVDTPQVCKESLISSAGLWLRNSLQCA